MDRPSLAVTRLEVRRFRGFQRADDAFALSAEDLCSGVNLIYGPNASGKTTVALALQALLWPEQAGRPHPSLAGSFTAGDGRWEIDLEAGQTTRRGEPADRGVRAHPEQHR